LLVPEPWENSKVVKFKFPRPRLEEGVDEHDQVANLLPESSAIGDDAPMAAGTAAEIPRTAVIAAVRAAFFIICLIY
jgi:hypothetical protein